MIESDSWTGKMALFKGSLTGSVRAVGACVMVGGTIWNTLKGGGTEKSEGKTKILRREQAGQGVSALTMGGGGGGAIHALDILLECIEKKPFFQNRRAI